MDTSARFMLANAGRLVHDQGYWKMNKARSLKQKPAPQAEKESYRPKSEVLRRRLSERGTRIIDLPGHYEKWTPEELAMIGTLPDREVAHRIGRSLSAVRRKRAALRDG